MKNIICFIITVSILIAVSSLIPFSYFYIPCIIVVSILNTYLTSELRKDRIVINELIRIRTSLSIMNSNEHLLKLKTIENRLMILYKKHADRNIMMKEEIDYYLKITRDKII